MIEFLTDSSERIVLLKLIYKRVMNKYGFLLYLSLLLIDFWKLAT